MGMININIIQSLFCKILLIFFMIKYKLNEQKFLKYCKSELFRKKSKENNYHENTADEKQVKAANINRITEKKIKDSCFKNIKDSILKLYLMGVQFSVLGFHLSN